MHSAFFLTSGVQLLDRFGSTASASEWQRLSVRVYAYQLPRNLAHGTTWIYVTALAIS